MKSKSKSSIWIPLVSILIGIIVVVWVYNNEINKAPVVTPTTNYTKPLWQVNYATQIQSLNQTYTAETSYLDYSSFEIMLAANGIAQQSTSVEDAVDRTINYVYFTVAYNAGESDQRCFDAKSSEILSSKTGQCDTQTLTVESLLRAQGIATRSVGGCVYRNTSTACTTKSTAFAVFSTFGAEIRQPKFTEIDLTQIQEGNISRAGYLHLWGEYYNPSKGWVAFESTAGQLIEGNCYVYNRELYPENVIDRCISQDTQYASWCASVK